MKKQLTQKAKLLRKNLTDAEQKLWNQICNKQLGVKFRRQQFIGKYIVDFVSLKHKLILEVDGGQHNETMDRVRENFLRAEGFQILRFWNNDVLQNTEGVVETILKQLHPHLSSPLKGEE
jgi:very-short-patch-repair endonuclease